MQGWRNFNLSVLIGRGLVQVSVPPVSTSIFVPMPPPQKGYKVINHRDVQYRWIMQNRRGVNELVIEASAPVNGQVLTAELPRIVSYDMVTEAIDFGNANGWKPNDSGPVFRCKWARKAFHLEES
jgi:hypothetical protein